MEVLVYLFGQLVLLGLLEAAKALIWVMVVALAYLFFFSNEG